MQSLIAIPCVLLLLLGGYPFLRLCEAGHCILEACDFYGPTIQQILVPDVSVPAPMPQVPLCGSQTTAAAAYTELRCEKVADIVVAQAPTRLGTGQGCCHARALQEVHDAQSRLIVWIVGRRQSL